MTDLFALPEKDRRGVFQEFLAWNFGLPPTGQLAEGKSLDQILSDFLAVLVGWGGSGLGELPLVFREHAKLLKHLKFAERKPSLSRTKPK